MTSQSSGVHTVVIIGGAPILAEALLGLPTGALYIAADSGLDHALAAGLRPTVLVGDLDSVGAAALAWAHEHNVEILEHSPDKDFTDTELAISVAVLRGATHLTVLSGGGDRLDHSLGALTALGHASLCNLTAIEARWADSLVRVLHGPAQADVRMAVGATFSVLALHGPADGVVVEGARWPLHDAHIDAGSSYGVSNVAVASTIAVGVRSGVLTVIRPHTFQTTGDHS